MSTNDLNGFATDESGTSVAATGNCNHDCFKLVNSTIEEHIRRQVGYALHKFFKLQAKALGKLENLILDEMLPYVQSSRSLPIDLLDKLLNSVEQLRTRLKRAKKTKLRPKQQQQQQQQPKCRLKHKRQQKELKSLWRQQQKVCAANVPQAVAASSQPRRHQQQQQQQQNNVAKKSKVAASKSLICLYRNVDFCPDAAPAVPAAATADSAARKQRRRCCNNNYLMNSQELELQRQLDFVKLANTCLYTKSSYSLRLNRCK